MMLGFSAFSMKAQDSWVVYLNKVQVLQSTQESPEKNIVSINEEDLKNKQVFTLTYFDREKQKDWSRFIMLNNSEDHEIRRLKSNRLRYTNQDLLKLLQKYKTIHIYTWALPDDPALRKRIRVRRVHLCTLVLE